MLFGSLIFIRLNSIFLDFAYPIKANIENSTALGNLFENKISSASPLVETVNKTHVVCLNITRMILSGRQQIAQRYLL